jgi:hypothetical protein
VIQELAVAAIVLLAALYVGAKYLPAAWRRRLVFALSRSEGESRLTRWLGTEASCGAGCASCKACAPATPDAAGNAPSAETPAPGGRRVIKLHERR